MSDIADGSITALVAAGRRPGVDSFAVLYGVKDKALIDLNGRPMLAYVLDTLLAHPAIGRIRILTQKPDTLLAHPDIAVLAQNPCIDFLTGGDSVSTAVSGAIDREGGDYPFLLTTADNPLLDKAILDAFIAQANGTDVAAGVVERRIFRADYPDAKRTWLHFARGSYSGSNIFWFGSNRAQKALNLWRTIEQDRKKGRAVIRAFGIFILLGSVLRILTLNGALARAGKRMKIHAIAVELPYSYACIDVDKPADHMLATRLLTERGTRIDLN